MLSLLKVPGRHWRRRAFQLARAYDWLIRRSKDPYLPNALINAMLDAPLALPDSRVQWLVSSDIAEHAQTYVAQQLLSTIRIPTVQTLILATRQPDMARTYALPYAWLRVLESHGVKVQKSFSKLAWLKLQLSVWRTVLANWRSLLKQANGGWSAPGSSYAVLLGAPPARGRQPVVPDGFSLFDWLARHPDIMPANELMVTVDPSATEATGNGDRIRPVTHPFPRLHEIERPGFRRQTVALLVKAAVLNIFGCWWAPFLVQGAMETAYFERLKWPAHRYIFTIAVGMFLKPLWTYQAERQGVHCLLLYYGTNTEPLAGDFPHTQFPGVQLQNWKTYVAFNDTQEAWLRALVRGAPHVIVKEAVDFADDPTIDVKLPPRTILALDVNVRKLLWWPANGFIDHYYVSEFAEAFFDDLAEVASQLDANVAWKGKRVGNGPRAYAYERAIQALGDKAPLITLDPALSPRRLARHAKACIAVPFTAAGPLFKAGGAPAAYYDALARIPGCGAEVNGLPLLRSRDHLLSWLDRALETETEEAAQILQRRIS